MIRVSYYVMLYMQLKYTIQAFAKILLYIENVVCHGDMVKNEKHKN